MPWRNGGGTTTEIAIAPEGAGLAGERFLYRVSIADVSADGPFSAFPGYDRHIMLLEGAGMTLDCGSHGSIALRPFEPRAFSGDWEVKGELARGAVRDFNVMVDRARATSTLDVRVITEPEEIACDPGNTCVVYVIDGSLASASKGETLIAQSLIQLVPHTPSRVAIARIVPIAIARMP